MELHTYKICQLLPRDAEQKIGRPPRDTLITWKNLTDQEVIQIRTFQEPRLLASQFAELDGKIVARGLASLGATAPGPDGEGQDDADDADDADDDADDADDADDEDDADDADEVAVARRDDPVALTKRATRMVWDAFRQHAAASAELREQTNELNRRAIAQAKQLDEALSAMQNRQPSPPINIDMEDLKDILRIGARMVRDFRGGSEPGPEEE